MQGLIQTFIEKHQLFTKRHKLLVAVSGGVDSMVLLKLLHQMGYAVVVAHANFGLRGEESELDEQWVTQQAQNLDVPFFSEKLLTEQVVSHKGYSIQMAARELRYEWFEKLCDEQACDVIVTAHHQTDVVETMLLNLVRGTGITGLHGILPRNGRLVRPLLSVTKDQILTFAKEEGVAYREDSSNEEVKYRRNRIRHEVLPALRLLNPKLEATFWQSAQHIHGQEQVFQQMIDQQLAQVQKVDAQGRIALSIEALQQLKPLETYAFAFLQPYNFDYATVLEIVAGLAGQPGKLYESTTHRLLKDRQFLILEAKEEEQLDPGWSIEQDQSEVTWQNNHLLLEVQEQPPQTFIDRKEEVYLDLAKLKFPLQLRKWHPGDRFKPLGMEQFKKLSDFLIDTKVSRLDKDQVYVMLSDQEIVWVVGHRIDHRYRVTEQTKQVLQLLLK